MEVRYRNDLYGNYMLIEIPASTEVSQYTFKMLEKNKISGVLSCKERMEDGKSYWYVDISKKKNLIQQYKEKEMQLEDMVMIFQQMIPILEELRTYLLSENMVVMDPEYIFRDLEDHSLHVLILPWNVGERTLHRLAEFFLEKINHKDENAVNAAYQFYRQQSQSQFSLYQFLPVLEKESILKRQKIKEKEDNQYRELKNAGELWMDEEEKSLEEANFHEFDKKESHKTKEKSKGNVSFIFFILSIVFLILSFLPMISSTISISCIALSLLMFVGFVVLFVSEKKKKENSIKIEKEELYPIQEIDIGMKETVFFDSCENDEYLKLQWKEKGRKKQFILKEFPCTVGKMKEEVSLCISDISVSRIHCRFIERQNKVCIMDLNSTNGTCLNGLPLKNGEILEIEKNDEILIGKVKVNVV